MKYKKIILIIFTLSVLGTIFAVYKYFEYQNSIPYQLQKLGYQKEEREIIQKKVKNFKKILNMKYNENLSKIIKEKYFIEKNLDAYISYQKENNTKDYTYIVSVINTKANIEAYEKAEKADISKNDQILVNKHFYLTEDYVPSSIIDIPLKYAYENNQIRKDIYEIYKAMCDDAQSENIKLVATSGYRSYIDQKKIYDKYVKTYGEKYADSYAAKPGFSEHQTGLALDIIGFGTNRDTFEDSPAFTWLQNHAHEYGFILRFPKEKEDITGYAYEPWHYRYVGREIAEKIRNEKITYDEYFAFYLK